MSNLFLRTAVRTWFTLTSRDQASTQIQKLCDRYLALAALIDAESGEITCYSFQGDEQIFVHKDYKAKFQGLLTNATNDTKK